MSRPIDCIADDARPMIVRCHLEGESSPSSPPQAPAAMRQDQPPRPRLAFRVGVVGHRPNRLIKAKEPELRAVLAQLLAAVRDEVEAAWDTRFHAQTDGQKVVLRAISPLAEGADQLFADEGLNLGYSLSCIMPFVQAEYENDFTGPNAIEPGALDNFRRLLARGGQRPGFIKYELDGLRADAPRAYGAAGRVVLNQSDVLFVIWDGQRLGKRGGTEKTFDEALARGVPVVWIDAHDPSAWRIVDAAHPLLDSEPQARAVPAPASDPDVLRQVVKSLLALPQAGGPVAVQCGLETSDVDASRPLSAFLAERKPLFSSAVLWGAFQRLVGEGRRPSVSFAVLDFEQAVEREWPRDRSTPVGCVLDNLRPFYAWPDKLAVVYANRYRSAFLLAFLLAATAVGLALLPFGAQLAPHHPLEIVCIALELMAILVILILVWRARRQRWHERWLDYRMLAEMVRHLRLVAPLGGVRPVPPVPAHWATYGEPSATWMAWYARSVERDLGLPSAVVDKAYLSTCLEQLIQLIKGQVSFHAASARRSDHIEHRLHRWGILLLAATLLACGLHFAAGVFAWHLPGGLPAALTFCCGLFPALGAALAGILNQGEFRRVAKRSLAMREQLEKLLTEIENVAAAVNGCGAAASQLSPLVSARTSEVARLLVHEVLDWRVVFLDRPLNTPA